MTDYIPLPNGNCIARIPRNCSMAICKAVMQTYYPMFCKDMTEPNEFWHICPVTNMPTGEVLALIRAEPDRFSSSIALTGLDADEVLNNPEKYKDNEYFKPQAEFGATRIFYYPDQIPEFCKAAGLPLLEVLNETAVKPILTKAQLAKLEVRNGSI